MHDPKSAELHQNYIVKLSLVVSFFAFSISLFNFVMFKQNEFDPIKIEKALYERVEKKTRESLTKRDVKLSTSKNNFKRRMTSTAQDTIKGLDKLEIGQEKKSENRISAMPPVHQRLSVFPRPSAE